MKFFFIFFITLSIFGKTNTDNSNSVTLLGEIIAESSTIEDNDTKSNKINSQKIQKTSSKTLKEAISKYPSIHFNIGSRGEASFNLRGFTSREIPILINGIPIYMPYSGSMDLFKINTEMIEEIKINTGASSVLYGPNSMGGAINIVTKVPKKGLHINLWNEIGLKNNYYGGTTLSYTKNNFYLIFSPQYWYSDGYTMPKSGQDIIENSSLIEDKNIRENSQKKGYSTLVKLGYQNKKSSYELSYLHLNENRGMPIELNNSKARYWKFPDWKKNNLTFISDNKLNNNLNMKNRIFYDSYYNKLDGYKDIKFTKLKFNSIYDDYSYGFISNPKFDFLEINSLEFSIFYKHDIHREGEDKLSLNEYDNYAMDTFSIASEYRLELETISLVAGISYDLNTTNTKDNKLKTLSSINPQIKSIYWINDNYSLELSIAQKTRFPTLKELFSGYIDRNIPNALLKEESTIHYQAFFNANFEKFNAKAEFYYTDIKDMIENITISDKNAPQRVQQLQNIGKSNFIGTEISINTDKLYNYFSLSSSYNYQHSYSETLKDNKVPLQPKNIFKTAVTIYLPFKAYIYTDISFIGEQYELDYRDNWLKIPSYSIINLKYEQNVYKDSNNKVILYLKINNVLNSEIYTQNNFPLAGREFYFGLKYQY